MSEPQTRDGAFDEPFEWSDRDLAMLRRVHRRELLVCAISAAVTSAIVTTVLFFGFVGIAGV